MEDFFEELVRLMELLDSNQNVFEQDDTTIPEYILAEFDTNNRFAEVYTLEKIIDNTLAIPDFLLGRQYRRPEGLALHNARLSALRSYYLSVYLPLLREFNIASTLPGGDEG